MYRIYIDDILLPITPQEIFYTIDNQNKTLSLLEDKVIFMKKRGPISLQFEALLPATPYPFAHYENDFIYPQKIVEHIVALKNKATPIALKITRTFPNGALYHDTHMYVSLEDIFYYESALEGQDIRIKLSFIEFKGYGVKRYLTDSMQNDTLLLEEKNLFSNHPKDTQDSYTVKKGDTLWGICRKIFGDGSLYHEVAEKNNISNPHEIYPGQVIYFE